MGQTTRHQMHIITSINMRGNSSSNNNNRNRNKVVTTDDSKWKIFPSSLDSQERSASTGSTISTGGHNIKEMLLSPIAACRSPSSVTEMNHIVTSSAAVGCCTPPHSAPSSPPASPKHQHHNKKSNNNKRFPVESSSVCPNGRKKALYRNRTSPPHYNKKNSIPRTHSSPSLSSSHGVEEEEEQSNSQTTPSSSSEVLIGENLLDKAALESCNSWNDAESLYSFSSRDHLLDIHNNNLNRAAISQQQPPPPHQSSCSSSSYDCNYKFSQEKAYEEFGVERKLIDKNIMGSSSSSKNQGGKKKKHWIRLRQSVLSSHSPQVTLPRKPSLSSLKKPTGTSSSSLNLPPSGKSSTTQKSTTTTTTRAVRKSSAPPTYFNVDVSRDYNRVPREENDGHYSVGYYSAPIEMELRPDRSLSQMGMEVTEEDYCIEGEYMSRQFQKQPQQQHNVSGCTSNQRKGSKKPSESVFSMKELAKGLEGSARSKSCSPKVIKTKVLSALRRVGSGDNVTKDASGTKKKIPHQIAITVTPSSSEDAAEDRLSLDELKMLYRWQKARCQKDMNQFSSSVSCNADDDCTHVETAITKTVMSEDGMSITSSVGDRTVSVDNRRSSIKRQLNRQVSF